MWRGKKSQSQIMHLLTKTEVPYLLIYKNRAMPCSNSLLCISCKSLNLMVIMLLNRLLISMIWPP